MGTREAVVKMLGDFHDSAAKCHDIAQLLNGLNSFGTGVLDVIRSAGPGDSVSTITPAVMAYVALVSSYTTALRSRTDDINFFGFRNDLIEALNSYGREASPKAAG